MKFCKDCNSFDEYTGTILNPADYSRCTSPHNPVNKVTGEIESNYCATCRFTEDKCGPDAKWWVPKDGVAVEVEVPDSKFKKFLRRLLNV